MSLFDCFHDNRVSERLNRNTISSIIAGALFALGWWIIIDCTCQNPTTEAFNKVFYLIGVVSTLALILVNLVSNSQVRGDSYNESCLGTVGSRVLLFISLVMSFGGLIGAGCVLFIYYIPHKSDNIYPGVAILCQNLAIFLSTLVLKFGRKEELDY